MLRPHAISSVRIGATTVHDALLGDIIARAASALTGGPHLTVFYVNAHTVRLAWRDQAYAQDLEAADLRICDGYGPWLVSRVLGRPLRSRMTPPDWIDDLLGRLSTAVRRIFLLGDRPETVDAAAYRVRKLYPHVSQVGTHHGFFDQGGNEGLAVAETIRECAPDVLLVGMGQPQQEQWVVRTADTLAVPIVIAVGALFQWWSGADRRAPKWLTGAGLEWLARLARHPVRHWNRYVIGLPIFLWVSLRSRSIKG